MYEELVKRLREHNGWALNETLDEAADAIEELQADNAALNRTVSNIIQQIAELSKPHWIPVTERLPEIKEHHVSDDVIVYLSDGGLGFSALKENIFGQTWFECEQINPDGESKWEVTHWMPLPQPPTECRQTVTDGNQLIGDSEQLGEPVSNPYKLEET